MKLSHLNPFVRLCAHISYTPTNTDGFPRDCRIIYVTQGSADLFVENEHYILQENSLFYCSSGVVYRIKSKSSLNLYILNFDLVQSDEEKTDILPVIPPEKADQSILTIIPFEESDFLNSHLCLSDASIFKDTINQIETEMVNRKYLFREKSGSLLKGLLTDLHKKNIKEDASPVLTKVTDYINENYTKNISNKLLSQMAGYHEYHLNRLFIKYTGKSIHQYILDLRLSKAKQLLLSSSMPLNIIAENCGFLSFSYFSSYFKKQTGITPSVYRNKYSKSL